MADTSNHNAPDPPDGEALAGRSDMSQIRLRKPELFGSYELLARMRVGGMAEIFRARELAGEGRAIALKRILPSFTDEADYVAMFMDEARLALRLSHPGIVDAYEMGQEEDSLFIALELVDGQDAGVLIHRACERAEPLPVGLACHLGIAVCEALHYAHELTDEAGAPLAIVHRDVSPQNILVAYDGAVKLIDFGIAKSAEQVMKTQAGFLKGKHGYLSPEQAAGEAVDRRSDVFSLAVCLYELLTAERLFKGASDFSTLQLVKKAEVPALSEKNPKVPEALEAILKRALAKKPDDRHGSAAELGAALTAFVEKEGIAFGRANLAAFMEETFAEVRAQADREEAEALAHGDEGTGLSAFDDLDPPSAVSTLSQLTAAEAIAAEGWDEAAEVASAELQTVEPASIEAIEVDDDDIEPLSNLGALDEEELAASATPAEPTELADVVTAVEGVKALDTAADADGADAADAEPDPMEDSLRPAAAGAADGDRGDVTAVGRGRKRAAKAKDAAAAEDEDDAEGVSASGATAESEGAEDAGDAVADADDAHDGEAAAVDAADAVDEADEADEVDEGEDTDAVSDDDIVTASESAPPSTPAAPVDDVVAAAVEPGSVPGHLKGATMPGLGMDWDDEELSTQVYDGQDGSDPAMPRPLPPVGAPSPFAKPAASVRPSVPPVASVRPGSLPPAPPVPNVGQVRMPGAPSIRPAYPTPQSMAPASLPPPAQRMPATSVVATVVGIIVLIAAGLYFFREPAMATVHLNTSPPDTLVTLDGSRVPGTSSPFVITDVSPGDHHVLRVEKAGYAAWSTQISPREGQVVQLPRVELMPEVGVNVAAALAEPSAAPAAAPEAAAQEAEAPAAAPAPERPAAPRAKPAASSKRAKPTAGSRFDRVRSEPKVAAGRNKPASAPKASAGQGGILRINSRPWAKVIIDGRTIGNTPQMRIPVSAGKHTVTLTNPQFGVKQTLTLDVKPGETVTRIVTLTP